MNKFQNIQMLYRFNFTMTENYKQRLSTNFQEEQQSNKNQQLLGVQGKFQWPIRLASPLGLIIVLLVNYLMGINKNAEVSDKFSLWVTPPGYFFTVWAVIYTLIIISNIYNLIRNEWNLKTHIYFGISNIINIVWSVVFIQGTLTSTVFASFLLLGLCVSLLLTWIQMGNIPQQKFSIWTYLNRNCFAFYLGWCIAATNLNFGMDIVYWWGATKQQQMIVFWVFAPLCAFAAFAFNTVKYGQKGMLSCVALWITVTWAFVGAGISSYNCNNGLSSNC